MPRGDGTGPMSQGPMTGRNAGFCAGFPVPGYMHPGPGGGRSFGRKGGHGYRHMYYATGLPGWMRFSYDPGWTQSKPFAPPYYQPAVPGYEEASPKNMQNQERKLLEQQADHLEKMRMDIKNRIKALEDEDTVEDEE